MEEIDYSWEMNGNNVRKDVVEERRDGSFGSFIRRNEESEIVFN